MFLFLRDQPAFSNSYLNNKISDCLHWNLSLHIIYFLILSIEQDQPGIQKQTSVPFVHSFHRFLLYFLAFFALLFSQC